MPRTPTTVSQQQVRRSPSPLDDLTVGDYDSVQNLEDDLNYIRSVIRDFKGTVDYDSPVADYLEDIRARLEELLRGATLTDISLVNATTDTPPTGNTSNRVATTEFVHTAIGAAATLGDLHKTYTNNSSSITEWEINHGMGKYPSVAFFDSSNREKMVDVEYKNLNTIIIRFKEPRTGKAILN